MAAVAEQHSWVGSGTLCADWSHRPDKVNPKPLIPGLAGRALLIARSRTPVEAEWIATVRHRATSGRRGLSQDDLAYEAEVIFRGMAHGADNVSNREPLQVGKTVGAAYLIRNASPLRAAS